MTEMMKVMQRRRMRKRESGKERVTREWCPLIRSMSNLKLSSDFLHLPLIPLLLDEPW